MSVSFTEPQFNEEFLISEAPGGLSRDVIGLVASASYKSALVLGKVTLGTVTASAVTGTGNGTVTGAAKTATTKLGVYTLTCIAAATNGGRFAVVDPNGYRLPDALVAVAYSGQISFTIADGSTDYAVGDVFTITVAAGSNLYMAYDPTVTNGANVAAGVLLLDNEVGSGGGNAVVIGRLAEVDTSKLVWGSNVTTDGHKTAAYASLAERNIIGRSGVAL